MLKKWILRSGRGAGLRVGGRRDVGRAGDWARGGARGWGIGLAGREAGREGMDGWGFFGVGMAELGRGGRAGGARGGGVGREGGGVREGVGRGGEREGGELAGAPEGEEFFELGEEGGDAAGDEAGEDEKKDVIHHIPDRREGSIVGRRRG